ncbi:MAG TPA: cytochrome c [Gammaproteobacteria bacterium]
MNKIKSMTLSGLFLAGMVIAGNVVAAADQDDVIKKGRAHYEFLCANCHGDKADGTGIYAELLKYSPTNLANLKNSGNETIAERVLKAMSGRHQVGEGQKKNMPVFSDDIEINRVYEIIQYLKSIQK